MRKAPEEESKKMSSSLFKMSLWGSVVPARANAPPGFSVSRAVTPNGLFQRINGLKRFVSYSKRLH